ncbi:MAG: signal peptidase I [Actinobacteria bacterium]|nr:signal peptidase I [Actinomycetota bacterium]
MFRKGSFLREIPALLVVAVIVSLIIKTFIVQFFYIPSGSMENTLQIKDRVAVNKVPFLSREIHRGDVVVFKDPANWLPTWDKQVGNKYIVMAKDALVAVGILPNPTKQFLVKRVIGIGGDNIQCCSKDGKILVNGQPTDEKYIFAGNVPSDMKFNVTVPEKKLWVMGDHRGASADSRYHQDDVNNGFVPEADVVGRVVAVIWPFKNAKLIERVNALN